MNNKIVLRFGKVFTIMFSAFGFMLGFALWQYPVSSILPKETAYAFLTCLSVGLLTIVLLRFSDKIVLDGDTLTMRAYLHFVYTHLPRRVEININNIKEIKIATIAALAKRKANIEEASLHEKAVITYQEVYGPENEVTVFLFAFPQFTKVIKEIIRRRPEIKVMLSKQSVMDNLKDYQGF